MFRIYKIFTEHNVVPKLIVPNIRQLPVIITNCDSCFFIHYKFELSWNKLQVPIIKMWKGSYHHGGTINIFRIVDCRDVVWRKETSCRKRNEFKGNINVEFIASVFHWIKSMWFQKIHVLKFVSIRNYLIDDYTIH